MEGFLSKEASLVVCENFSQVYAEINNYIIESNEKWSESRDGNVKEVLNFTTQIKNPYRRCVGGYKRNMNVFFLLAEAMWIAAGHQDVRFLNMFNSNMSKYSDNGVSFHAPYGYRLRHWGVSSDASDIQNVVSGFDQVREAVKILHNNPNSRQVVMSIWNPKFDLGYITKDIPCNDMVMLKIRDGKLVTTIANRSNDLHYGLPTNIFQFSFLTEIIAGCLGIELGTQTHNSQSLHVYDWNSIAQQMNDLYKKRGSLRGIPMEMYYNETMLCERKMDFNFMSDYPVNRVAEVTIFLDMIISHLTECHKEQEKKTFEQELKSFSQWFYYVYRILGVYVSYSNTSRTKVDRIDALEKLVEIEEELHSIKEPIWDVLVLAKNFFFNRIDPDTCFSISGNL